MQDNLVKVAANAAIECNPCLLGTRIRKEVFKTTVRAVHDSREQIQNALETTAKVVVNTATLPVRLGNEVGKAAVRAVHDNQEQIQNALETTAKVVANTVTLPVRLGNEVGKATVKAGKQAIDNVKMLGSYLEERYTHPGLDLKYQYSSDSSAGEYGELLTEHEVFSSFDGDEKRVLHLDALALSQNIYVINGHNDNAYETYQKTKSKGTGWHLINENFPKSIRSHPKIITDFYDTLGREVGFKNFNSITSGLGSAVFYTVKGGAYLIAYVTEGSNIKLNDWINNFKQGADPHYINENKIDEKNQYNQSIINARKISSIFKKMFNLDKDKLYFFGHSLGGGLANANALATGFPAITFNAAALNSEYVKQKESTYKEKLLVGEYVENEILSLWCTRAAGMRKDGDRYKTKLQFGSRYFSDLPIYFNYFDSITRHMLEPLCKEHGLVRVAKLNLSDWI